MPLFAKLPVCDNGPDAEPQMSLVNLDNVQVAIQYGGRADKITLRMAQDFKPIIDMSIDDFIVLVAEAKKREAK